MSACVGVNEECGVSNLFHCSLIAWFRNKGERSDVCWFVFFIRFYRSTEGKAFATVKKERRRCFL